MGADAGTARGQWRCGSQKLVVPPRLRPSFVRRAVCCGEPPSARPPFSLTHSLCQVLLLSCCLLSCHIFSFLFSFFFTEWTPSLISSGHLVSASWVCVHALYICPTHSASYTLYHRSRLCALRHLPHGAVQFTAYAYRE
ncbi:unnamed protein product [Periconia digitata]|uniref:Uncharacterized protein n=1 Tax=Periconia digitata TaxID=1303443 RepID=A0A9W4UJK7_9PLEO|nr:unnamed protein product [Periconia digitata]